MTTALASPEKGLTTVSSVETQKLVVKQPAKLAELSKLLETFENLNARVSERTSEDVSGDLGGAGGATGGQGSAAAKAASARQQAIDTMPGELVIKKKLEEHIIKEVKKLNHQAKVAARSSRPGSAYRMNNFYAQIRRLNALLLHILESSVEVVQRLFIRVFIDHQPIL